MRAFAHKLMLVVKRDLVSCREERILVSKLHTY